MNHLPSMITKFVLTRTLLPLSVVVAFSATLIAQEEARLPVFGVHDLELRDGISSAEFDKFAKGKFAKAWREPRDGVRLMILKGDRGKRKGKYQMVYVFDSVAARNKHFPREGGSNSAAFAQAVQPVLEVMRELYRHVRTVQYTDYVEISY